MSRALAALAVLLAAAGSAPAAAGQATPQLQGTFQMSGTVTVAHNVRGEHVGDPVVRTWTFTPQCPTSPCSTVQLVRQRATGTDTLTLRQTGPETYAGTGSFYAPLRCTRRLYPRGQLVPFKIRLRVTAITGTVASAISAAYVNRSRTNLTPCIGVLGHDAARYTGQLVTG
jgi:hypothetical protein